MPSVPRDYLGAGHHSHTVKKPKTTGPCTYRSSGPNQASSHQVNKGREEIRNILKAEVNSEKTGFPFAEQAAKLDRFTSGRKPEQVILLTSRAPETLNALEWLKLNPNPAIELKLLP